MGRKYKTLYHDAMDYAGRLHLEIKELKLEIKQLKLELAGGSCDYCIHNDCLECVEA